MVKAFRLREEWLRRVADEFAPHIEKATGVALPPFRVSCGFPSTGGRKGGKKWTRGECWSATASKDGHAEIFINPGIDDAETVAAILAHELIHAALPDAGHKGPFQAAARKIGHEAPFTSANPTDDFRAWAGPIIAAAGAYPHAELQTMRPVGGKAKQSTRMVKCHCEACGYTVRTARKWLEAKGAPICPDDLIRMTCEGLETDGEGGEELEAA